MDILQVNELKQSLARRDARILDLERQLEAARQERGEAVAWMCQYSGSCWFTQSEVRAEMHRKAGWDVTPVYAHPTPDAGRVAELEAELQERLRANCAALKQRNDALDRIAALEAQLADIAAALPGPVYMDPPDGGDVSIAEQVRRMAAELERKQRECEGLRLWAEALEKDWLTREQWALIGGGMRLEQALIHANARMKQARAATIKAALSSGEKNDGHA